MTKLTKMLMPDYMFDSFDKITPDFLRSVGVSAVLVDIDNTLAPYETEVPDEKIIRWFTDLKKNEIKAALVSNNGKERVSVFNAALGLDAYSDCGKPSVKVLSQALEKLGCAADRAAGIGDQLLTDTLAAHRLGMISLIVPPIKDKKSLFFRLKREIEKPFIRKYKKRNMKK